MGWWGDISFSLKNILVLNIFSIFNHSVAMATAKLCNLHEFHVVDRELLRNISAKVCQISAVT